MANNNISIRLMLFVALLVRVGNAQPTPSPACSDANLLGIITRVVSTRVAAEPRMGASLLRLHFHDCFVNGCDGSVLLDDNSTTGFVGEKTAFPNVNSLRGFDVIDTIKSQVEAACPGRLSCADILAVAAREGVVASPIFGPSWPVALGRLDSTTANLNGANTQLPGPGSSLQNLIDAFSAKGFTRNEMVALSGSHTIGQARCLLFRNRIYNEPNINASFATTTRARCPSTSGSGDNNLSPLDVASPNAFNNDYYKNLINLSGLLHSDQVLFNNVSTDALVRSYAGNPTLFANDFARAMAKMARLPRPAGAAGQIRTNCRRVN